MAAVHIKKEEDIEKQRAAIRRAVDFVDKGAGVLMMADAMDESGGRLASFVAEEKQCEIVFGVNLSMLRDTLLARSEDYPNAIDLAEIAIGAGQEAVMRMVTCPIAQAK